MDVCVPLCLVKKQKTWYWYTKTTWWTLQLDYGCQMIVIYYRIFLLLFLLLISYTHFPNCPSFFLIFLSLSLSMCVMMVSSLSSFLSPSSSIMFHSFLQYSSILLIISGTKDEELFLTITFRISCTDERLL